MPAAALGGRPGLPQRGSGDETSSFMSGSVASRRAKDAYPIGQSGLSDPQVAGGPQTGQVQVGRTRGPVSAGSTLLSVQAISPMPDAFSGSQRSLTLVTVKPGTGTPRESVNTQLPGLSRSGSVMIGALCARTSTARCGGRSGWVGPLQGWAS